MANVLTLQGEITPDGHLRVELPADAPRGRFMVTLEPLPPDASAEDSQEAALLTGLPISDMETFRDGFENLLTKWGIRGEPISHLQLRELSRENELEPEELSRDLIAARDKQPR